MEDIDKSAMELLDFRTISNRDMADFRFFCRHRRSSQKQ
jgi:hypothetical protein